MFVSSWTPFFSSLYALELFKDGDNDRQKKKKMMMMMMMKKKMMMMKKKCA